MSKNKTPNGMRAGIAGVVGAVVAFGIAELVHGLYSSVPSILVSIAQRIVESTPGGLVTAGIELLDKADIPTLIVPVLLGDRAEQRSDKGRSKTENAYHQRQWSISFN